MQINTPHHVHVKRESRELQVAFIAGYLSYIQKNISIKIEKYINIQIYKYENI
jgi:hypothetical protein